MTSQLSEHDARAADSGASATRRFQEKTKAAGAVDTARVSALAADALAALHNVIREHRLSYAEYDAFKAWMIRVGEDGEWPLFLDVFVEHVVEQVNSERRHGSKGSIEGPYYIPGAPVVGATGGTLPMRTPEGGTPLLFQGQVTSVAGDPIDGATLELWQADDAGFYSQFAPGLPQWNLRGTLITGADGRFSVRTVKPAPYQIPHDGATGKLIEEAGWHAWRPAHMHLKVSAPGHQLITTQLYFPGDPHNGDDIAGAVKPELMLDPRPAPFGDGVEATYDFVLDPA